MKSWKAILGVCVVFLLGLLCGCLLTLGFIKRAVTRGPEAASQFVVHRLSRQLDLDHSQRERLQRTIQTAQKDMLALREKTRPERREILERAEAEVRSFLRPEQCAKFEKLVADAKAGWRLKNF